MLARQKRIVPEDDEVQFDVRSEDRNAEEAIIHNEKMQQLQAALLHLNEEQRTALVLFAFEDKSYNDIAAEMNWSLSKVESLIFRAKNNLRKMLTQ